MDLAEEADRLPDELPVYLVEIILPLLEADRLDRAEVVWPAALVEECHLSIPLEVAHPEGAHGLVDRELLVVRPDSVTVCVRVREETGLEDRIGRRLDTGHHVSGVVCHLLDFGEIVCGVLVESELADGSERVVLVRPDVGEIKHVDPLLRPSLLGLLLSHSLNLHRPRRVLAPLDGIVEILPSVVIRLRRSLVRGKVLGPLVADEVELCVKP